MTKVKKPVAVKSARARWWASLDQPGEPRTLKQKIGRKFKRYWRWILLLVLALIATAVYIRFHRQAAYDRRMDLDIQRITSLQQLSDTIVQFYHDNHRLPSDLTDIMGDPNPSFSRDSFMFDPETHNPYVYKPLSAARYKLCADFLFSSEAIREKIPYGFDQNTAWDHQAGLACYELAVTPRNRPN